MLFNSTRDKNISKTLSECIQLGLSPDGGLFVPSNFSTLLSRGLTAGSSEFNPDYSEFSANLLRLFFKDDLLFPYLDKICHNAFNFSLPLNKINHNTFMLNLCCGPTLSFKDFGARFLAECIHHMSTNFKTTIMVATSGDTGSAVASAFYEKENIQVILLYPKAKVSKKQEHQLTCWDKNILSLAVDGTFDDCQKLVKDAFNDDFFKNTMHLSSANSINIGRLLPQICYYAYTSVKYVAQYNKSPGFIIPTGNLGNATAAFWAKEMGFPLREIALSTNENKVLEDYIRTGVYKPRKSILTLANAMDVGNPSNFERLASLFPTYELFKKNISITGVSNDKIKETIKDIFHSYNTVICPHTATAFYARKKLSQEEPWIVVSTADPCKFDDIIEPLIQKKVPIAPQMEELLKRDVHYKNIAPNLEEVKRCAADYFKLN